MSTLHHASSPEEVGIPSGAIAAVLDRLEDRQLVSHSLLVARHGTLAFEGYWAPFDARVPHRLYSASKSFVSLAIGALVDDGRLSLTDEVAPYFADLVAADELHDYTKAMRVVDLLRMCTAHGETTYKRVADPDWVRTFFTVEPTRRPGMIFSYDTSASVVLAALAERLSGQSLPDYLMDRIFGRIGFEVPVTTLYSPTGMSREELGERPTWREVEDNPNGVSHGGSALYCTPRDFLRFGLLCLQQGRWGDEQILSAEYMQAATSAAVANLGERHRHPDDQHGYGYQFWRTSHNGFAARGMGGQIALCLPDHDMVVVQTADNQLNPAAGQQFFDAIWDELVPALAQAPLPEDAPAASALADRAAGLALSPVVASAVDPGDVVGEYTLDPGETDVVKLTVRIEGDQGELVLTRRGRDVPDRIPFGIGSFQRHPLPGYGYETLSSGGMVDPTTVYVRSHVLGLYLAQIELVVRVVGDHVVLRMQRAAEYFAEEFEGLANGTRSSAPQGSVSGA